MNIAFIFIGRAGVGSYAVSGRSPIRKLILINVVAVCDRLSAMLVRPDYVVFIASCLIGSLAKWGWCWILTYLLHSP